MYRGPRRGESRIPRSPRGRRLQEEALWTVYGFIVGHLGKRQAPSIRCLALSVDKPGARFRFASLAEPWSISTSSSGSGPAHVEHQVAVLAAWMGVQPPALCRTLAAVSEEGHVQWLGLCVGPSPVPGLYKSNHARYLGIRENGTHLTSRETGTGRANCSGQRISFEKRRWGR